MGLLLAAAAIVPAGAAAATVSAFPSPGTPTAYPQTSISFRGVDAAHLGPYEIDGSRSGRHMGTLVPHPDGKGVSFVPARPFTAGETVTVRTRLSIAGAHAGDFDIGIAQPGPAIAAAPVKEAPNTPSLIQAFHSRRDLAPPKVKVNVNRSGLAPGYVFVAPKLGPGDNGPLILDNGGNVVWFDKLAPGYEADDFRAQTYLGKPVLTWWEGHDNFGTGAGQGVIEDASYREIARVSAANGYSMDPHDFRLLPNGAALLLIEAPVHRDLSSIAGAKDAVAFDSVVQEVDVKTGVVLFQWNSLAHVDVNRSYVAPPKGNGHFYDYFHVNSAEPLTGGNFLISSRNT